jgi:hypothetical protein
MKTTTLLVVILTLLAGSSYRRLRSADESRFYGTRGAAFMGSHLHLHLPPTPFLSPPKKAQPSRRSPVLDQYTYRKVKFLVNPRNPYYQQFRRKRKSGKIVCVKGRVEHHLGKIGTAVRVHRIRAITKRSTKR